MNGRSSTFGGLLGYTLLIGFGIAGVVIVFQEIVGPIIRFLMPEVTP